MRSFFPCASSQVVRPFTKYLCVRYRVGDRPSLPLQGRLCSRRTWGRSGEAPHLTGFSLKPLEAVLSNGNTVHTMYVI